MSVLTTNHSALWMSSRNHAADRHVAAFHFLWQGAAHTRGARVSRDGELRAARPRDIGSALRLSRLWSRHRCSRFRNYKNRAASERYARAASAHTQIWRASAKKSAAIVPASPAPSAPFDLPANALAWLVEAWFAGVILFSMRTIGGVLVIEKLRRRASVPLSKELMATCVALQKRMGIARAIQYYQCARVEAPAVIGWLRPVVLLPITVITGLTDEQMRAVVAHELRASRGSMRL